MVIWHPCLSQPATRVVNVVRRARPGVHATEGFVDDRASPAPSHGGHHRHIVAGLPRLQRDPTGRVFTNRGEGTAVGVGHRRQFARRVVGGGGQHRGPELRGQHATGIVVSVGHLLWRVGRVRRNDLLQGHPTGLVVTGFGSNPISVRVSDDAAEQVDLRGDGAVVVGD